MRAFFQQLGRPLLLLLDYDGTLVPLAPMPELAVLPAPTAALLARLAAHSQVLAAVISGRSADFLDRQFRGLPLALIAEHGAKLRPAGAETWQTLIPAATGDWYARTEARMAAYSRQLPGALLEHKEFALAWHYRRVDPRLRGRIEALRLELAALATDGQLSLLEGDKVYEVRAAAANKGQFVRTCLPLLGAGTQVLALGDDATDEDMFAALPPGGIAIKVGQAPSRAGYRLAGPAQVLELLAGLLGALEA